MHTWSKFPVLVLALIAGSVLASGCGEDIIAPSTSNSGPDLEYDDTPPEHTALGNITFMDGSVLEFIDAGISIITVADHGEAQRQIAALRRSGRPDPVSVYEALSSGKTAPQALKDAVSRLGIPPSPVVLQGASDYYLDTDVDSPNAWLEYYSWCRRARADILGDRTYDLEELWGHNHVHSRVGKIRVRVYQEYFDLFSFSSKWRLLADKTVYEKHTLSVDVYIPPVSKEMVRVRVTDASGNYWHLAQY